MKKQDMDLSTIVERITREIVANVRPAAPAGGGLSAQAVKQILVVFSGAEGQNREIVDQLRQIGGGLPLTLVVPRWGQGLFSALAQSQPEWQFLAADGERIDPQELLLHHDLIIIPDLKEKTARQLASFQGSQYPASLVLGALHRNKKVILGGSYLTDQGRRHGDMATVLDTLRQMGLIVTETKGLAATARGIIQSCATCVPGEQRKCATGGGDCFNCGHGLCVQKAPGRVDEVMAAGANRISASLGVATFRKDLASVIDHTLLKAEATEQEVNQLCAEARQYGFASVCINPTWVELCARLLAGSGVKVCTVIGFPLGATTAAAKAAETRDAIARGAQEVDMVINIGALKSGHYRIVEDDIRGVVQAAQGNVSKVILETCLLTDEEKIMGCQLSRSAGATFVKTSTGFNKSGATVQDIALMRRVVGPEMGVKASGGVRDCATAEEMVKAGATRIGASASIAIAKCEPTSSKKGDGY